MASRASASSARHLGRGFHRLYRHAQHLKAQGRDAGLLAQHGLGVARDFRRSAKRLRQGHGLHLLLNDHLHLGGHPPAQALRVFRGVGGARSIERKIKQAGRELGVADPVAHLALHRDALKIGAHQGEHERLIAAGHRHGHHRGRGRVIKKRLSNALAHHAPFHELHEVHGGLGFDKADAKHGKLLSNLGTVNTAA